MTETDCLERAARLTQALEALSTEIARLGAERRALILALVRKHGWSHHQVAEGLGISQPRVSTIMRSAK